MSLGELFLDEHERKLGHNSVKNSQSRDWRKEACCPVCGEAKTVMISNEHRYACGFRADWTGVLRPCTRQACSCKIGTLMKYGCVCG